MNIFQPIKLTVVTPSAEAPILSQHKKRFYTYIPSAMVFLTMRYADELRQMVISNKLPYKSENRKIRNACEVYKKLWYHKMQTKYMQRFEKIVDDLCNMFHLHLQNMFFTLDAVLIKHEPDNDFHNIASFALLVEFLCSYCMRLDKEAYQAMPRDKTGICMEWVPDYNVVEIQRCARIISNGLSIQNDSDLSNDKTLFDQVKLAIDVINMQLENYTFVI